MCHCGTKVHRKRYRHRTIGLRSHEAAGGSETASDKFWGCSNMVYDRFWGGTSLLPFFLVDQAGGRTWTHIVSLRWKIDFSSNICGCSAPTPCYAIVLPGQKSGSRAAFRTHSNQEVIKIGPQAGRRPAGGLILKLSRFRIRPGNPISGPEALLRNKN